MVTTAKKPPAKRKLKPVTGPLAVIDKPVDFGGVSIGKTTGRIGVSMGREWMAPNEAAEFFCNRRLTGKVVLGRKGDAANQTTLVADLAAEVAGAFDVKGFRVTEEILSAGLTFSLAEVDIAELAKFSKGVGRLVIYKIGDIPADAPEEFEEAEGQLAFDGPWADAPLAELFEGRILKALNGAKLQTVGDLAAATAKGDFWADDVKGIGAAARQQIEDRMEQFWKDNPQAT